MKAQAKPPRRSEPKGADTTERPSRAAPRRAAADISRDESAVDKGISYFDILENSRVRFGYRIAVLANWYRGPGYKEIEQKFGLTEPECSALFCIGHASGITATDVCGITGRPKNSISRAIHILLRKKLIVRTTDSIDARKKRLSLTDAGQGIFVKTIPIFTATESRILQPLSASELSDLDRLLTKMIANVTVSSEVY